MLKWNKISIALLAMSLVAGTSLKAQAFKKGTIILSATHGFGNLTTTTIKESIVKDTAFGGLYGRFGFSKVYFPSFAHVGPIHLKGEYGLRDHVSIGLNIAYTSVRASDQTYSRNSLNDSTAYIYKETFTAYSILGRVNIHIGHDNKLDPYVGVGVGYRRKIVNIR